MAAQRHSGLTSWSCWQHCARGCHGFIQDGTTTRKPDSCRSRSCRHASSGICWTSRWHSISLNLCGHSLCANEMATMTAKTTAKKNFAILIGLLVGGVGIMLVCTSCSLLSVNLGEMRGRRT